MAFDISALENVASVHSLELATRAISGSATAKLFIDNKAVQTGVKGSAVISQLESDINLQDASNCSTRSPVGSTKISNKRINVSSLKDQQNICPKALYNTWFSEMIGKGQDPAGEDLDASFINSIINYRTAKLAGVNEKGLWQGDTTITLSNPAGNLTKYNGILQQLAAGGSGATSITAAGSDMVAELQSIYSQSNVDVRHSDDFRLFVGQDTYDAYASVLAAKNLYNPTTDMTIFGTLGKMFVAPGLNGTHKVVAGRIADFALGMDGTDDSHKVTFLYSMETQQWYMDIYWSIGVAVVFPDEVGYSTVS